MKLDYLEVVSHDADAVCKKVYELSGFVSFNEPNDSLGGVKTCTIHDGSIVGVRGPLCENEEPIVCPSR